MPGRDFGPAWPNKLAVDARRIVDRLSAHFEAGVA
jgi:hypothetical protein